MSISINKDITYHCLYESEGTITDLRYSGTYDECMKYKREKFLPNAHVLLYKHGEYLKWREQNEKK